MAGKLQKYILLNDRMGECIEKGYLLSITFPTQLLRGEILESLLEPEQPDPEKIALQAISAPNQQSIKLECPTLDVSKITDSEADLLLAISSVEERFRTYRERNRLTDGKSLEVGSKVKVFVKVNYSTKVLTGIIWYKGPLPTHNGTMFGVELLGKESEGLGTCDGTFKNKRYFACPPAQGVFVALDKLNPLQDEDKSPKKETRILSTIKYILPSFSSKDPSESVVRNMAKEHRLKIDQRVVVFLEEVKPLRGTVRYISEIIESDGDVPVGIELDRKMGIGTGMFRGKQRFVCKKDYALFAPVTSIIPEEEYDTYEQGNAESYGFARASLGYHEANSESKNPENEGNKKSNPATSSSCLKSSEEDGGKQQANEKKIREEQRRILRDIKAKQRSKTDNHTDGMDEPGKDEHLSFHEEHFQISPKVNTSEWPQPHSTWHSTFYQPSEGASAPCEPQGLEVGSMVEVPIMEGKGTQYGVIRWIGQLPELPGKIAAGLELETKQVACSDGTFAGKRYFTCPAGRAFFVNIQHCRKDSRFQAQSPGEAKYSGRR